MLSRMSHCLRHLLVLRIAMGTLRIYYQALNLDLGANDRQTGASHGRRMLKTATALPINPLPFLYPLTCLTLFTFESIDGITSLQWKQWKQYARMSNPLLRVSRSSNCEISRKREKEERASEREGDIYHIYTLPESVGRTRTERMVGDSSVWQYTLLVMYTHTCLLREFKSEYGNGTSRYRRNRDGCRGIGAVHTGRPDAIPYPGITAFHGETADYVFSTALSDRCFGNLSVILCASCEVCGIEKKPRKWLQTSLSLYEWNIFTSKLIL